jgi:hyperosmotically inducible protein
VLRRLMMLVVFAALLAGGYFYLRSRGWAHAPTDFRALGRHFRDAKVTASVKAALEINRGLSASDVDVSTEDGVVTLRGVVPDGVLKERAESLAAAVPGVRQVVNHMRISADARAPATPDRSLGESLDDRTVEMRVRLALKLNRALDGATIDVAVLRREVTLAGEVSDSRQAETAVLLARETAGVLSVVDRLGVRSAGAPRAERVRRAFDQNPHLARYGLSARERNGRLEIAGRVATGTERDLAGLVAEKAAGASVDNRVTVGR